VRETKSIWQISEDIPPLLCHTVLRYAGTTYVDSESGAAILYRGSEVVVSELCAEAVALGLASDLFRGGADNVRPAAQLVHSLSDLL